MQIKDTARFNSIVETAKAKAANSPAWQRCLDKASKMMISGELVVTLLADGALVTSPNGSYRVTAGRCDCPARTSHCYHRCAVRLAELMDAPAAVSPADVETVADVAATPRKQLIIEIENVWPETWPPIFRELLARFGKSHLHMLDDDMLRRVRLAIAM